LLADLNIRKAKDYGNRILTSGLFHPFKPREVYPAPRFFIGVIMKMFILYVLVPLKLFSCQFCIYEIQEKIDAVTLQLVHAECCEHFDASDIYYLFGQLDGYYNALKIVGHNHD